MRPSASASRANAPERALRARCGKSARRAISSRMSRQSAGALLARAPSTRTCRAADPVALDALDLELEPVDPEPRGTARTRPRRRAPASSSAPSSMSPATPADAVEVSSRVTRATRGPRAIRAAIVPAPKPSSMFTTATPAAQEVSIASSAVDAAERRAVAGARRHADHRRGDEAADHGGERRVLPGHHDHAVRPREIVQRRREPVQARHAGVLVHDDLAPEQLGAHARLVHHGPVGGPAGHDRHEAARLGQRARDPDAARARVAPRRRARRAHGGRAAPRRRASRARCRRRRRAATATIAAISSGVLPSARTPRARPAAARGGCPRARSRGREKGAPRAGRARRRCSSCRREPVRAGRGDRPEALPQADSKVVARERRTGACSVSTEPAPAAGHGANGRHAQRTPGVADGAPRQAPLRRSARGTPHHAQWRSEVRASSASSRLSWLSRMNRWPSNSSNVSPTRSYAVASSSAPRSAVHSNRHSGNAGLELREVDAVAARVRRRSLRERHLAVRQTLVDDLGEFADAVVLLGRADVERLARDDARRGASSSASGRRGDVADVDERAPRRAVALQADRPVVCAQATRLLRTTSRRSRGETP